MKSKIFSIIGLIAVIFFFTSGLFEWCTNVVVWLVTLDMSAPTISIIGEIFVKYATWLITFSIVGTIFKSFGWFDSAAMKIVYAIISTIISFVLSFVIMVLENYLIYIVILLVSVICLMITIGVILHFKNRNKNRESNYDLL